jgi:hypothetical protein
MMVLEIRCQALVEDIQTIGSCCLYIHVFCYYHILSYLMYIWLCSCLILYFMYFYCYVLLYVYAPIACLCIYFMFMYSLYVYRASWHSSATLTEVFPCFFLSCKANARVKPANMGHSPHSFKIFVLFYVLFVLRRSMYCLCVNVCCTAATGWLPNCS